MLKNRKNNILIISIAAAITLCAGSAASQGMVDIDTAKSQVERTDDIISEAKSIIEESRSQKARLSLDEAIKIQNRARNFLTANNSGFAYRYTMEARKEAWHAVGLARDEARLEEKTRRLDEKTGEMLAGLRSGMIDGGIKDARLTRLIEESMMLLEKSRINAQQLRNQLAFKLVENARKLANQAQERFRKVRNEKETCERRMMLVEKLLGRAGERISAEGAKTNENQLRLAERTMEQAKNNFASGRYRSALVSLEKCEKILRNLTRRISGEDSAEPARIIDEALALRERAWEMIGDKGAGQSPAMGFMERADRLLERSRLALRDGRKREALEFANQARRLMRQAIETGEVKDPAARAESEIRAVGNIAESVTGMLAECDDEGAGNLYERAAGHLAAARKNFESNDYQRAYAEARIARNLFNRIKEICSI